MAALSACETETIGEKMVGNKIVPPPSTLVEETFGRGTTEITLLMAKSANGRYEGAARDIRDGAALAVGELDEGGVLKIRVVDVSAGPSSLASAVGGAVQHDAALVISYAPQATTAALAAMPAGQRPPVLNLGDAVSGQDIFNFGPDEIASATRGARFAVSSGQRRIAVLAPASMPAGDDERLRNAIAQAGGLSAGIVRYPANAAAAAAALTGAKPMFDAADAVIIMGESPVVGSLLHGVRSGFPKLAVVGTDHWPFELQSDPAAANVVLSAFDPDGLSVIRERYKRYNQRDLSVYSALGYDSLAVLAGLVRGNGREGLTAEALRAKTGFRGTTGLFRFTPAGNVERREGLYRITGGKLVPIEAGGAARF